MLCEQVSHSGQQHEEVTLALLYSILTDPNLASKVHLISHDAFTCFQSMHKNVCASM